MKLYWKPMWMTDADARRTAADFMGDGFMMSNQRLEKIIDEAYARGKKDGHHDSMRDGVLNLGEAVRERIARWPLLKHEAEKPGAVAVVPAWDLEALLSQWNVPEAAPTNTNRPQQEDAS